MLSDLERREFLDAFEAMTPFQRKWVLSTMHAFKVDSTFLRHPESDIVSEAVLDLLGNRLLSHHAGSRQALTKDRFEFAFEAALVEAGVSAELAKSRVHNGADIWIGRVPFSLKTEAAAAIKSDILHISKWMELGRGEWDLEKLRDRFLEHLEGYARILTLRRLRQDAKETMYELVEIPKSLLLEAACCRFEVCTNSRQTPQPGYGHVETAEGVRKFSLYFDGGTERKLQIRGLQKSLCQVHATWRFGKSID